MTNLAGSESGSISQRHGSEDPDPDPPQNVMDPQHCLPETVEDTAYSAVAGYTGSPVVHLVALVPRLH
jgi:hypothetical protein